MSLFLSINDLLKPDNRFIFNFQSVMLSNVSIIDGRLYYRKLDECLKLIGDSNKSINFDICVKELCDRESNSILFETLNKTFENFEEHFKSAILRQDTITDKTSHLELETTIDEYVSESETDKPIPINRVIYILQQKQIIDDVFNTAITSANNQKTHYDPKIFSSATETETKCPESKPAAPMTSQQPNMCNLL